MQELDIYSSVPMPKPRPGQLVTGDIPPAGICTAGDPMGTGRTGPVMHAPAGGERSLEQEIARRDRSETDFGDALLFPILESGKIYLKMREPQAWSEALSFAYSTYKDGVEQAGAEQALSLVIDKTVDAFMRSKGIRYDKSLQAMKPLLKETINMAIQSGGGLLKDWYEKHRERNGGWSQEDNDIQAAIDRDEDRRRLDPGATLA